MKERIEGGRECREWRRHEIIIVGNKRAREIPNTRSGFGDL